jgi:hypothetical protein
MGKEMSNTRRRNYVDDIDYKTTDFRTWLMSRGADYRSGCSIKHPLAVYGPSIP